MATKRNPCAPYLHDRWMKTVVNPDKSTKRMRSNLWGKGTRWMVRWVDQDGREGSKSGFSTKEEAEEYRKELTSDVHLGHYVSPQKGATHFEVVAEQWYLTKSHVAPKTYAGYRSLLDTIVLPQWGNVPVADIDYEKYSQWIGSLSVDGSQKGTPLSASRITQAHQLAGAVLKYAQKTGKVAKNVALELKRSEDLPQPVEKERRYLTHAELLTLASGMGRFETLTLLMGYCGLRIGEASGLRRKHVNLEDQTITTSRSATYVAGIGVLDQPQTKTRRIRDVPVPAPIWKRIVAELPEGREDLLFPSHRGIVLPLEEYRAVFDKACAAAGIEGLTPHGLRHTCASLAIRSGANIKVVQHMLGHRTAAMTLDLYGHLYRDDLDEVAVRLGRALEEAAVALRNPKPKRVKKKLLETA